MHPVSLNAVGNLSKLQLIMQMTDAEASKVSIYGDSENKLQDVSLYLNGKLMYMLITMQA